jgi:hypothetical protein
LRIGTFFVADISSFFLNFIPFAWQERQRVVYDEQKKLAQHQAQTKSQMARYEDELARKRMQACTVNISGLKGVNSWRGV